MAMRESAHSRFRLLVRTPIGPGATRLNHWADENWKWLTFLLWLGIATYYLALRANNIHWFALGDTDDNMRYLQVRDWLAGQGWFDLRQYRLDPPTGANIHWSRLVDLPIAALMLFFRLFTDAGTADRLACAIAPLLPLLLLMLSLTFITRRLCREGSPAWIIAALLPLAAPLGLSMYVPLRIDHHGWQLAFTVAMLAGIVDRQYLRGGVVAGLASALSIAIGMEMIVYLAGAGALIALRWVFKEGAARRMLPYALSLGGGTCALYAGFASYANRVPMCDALSPVWVATLGMAAGGMVLLALLPLKSWPQRLAAGVAVGAMVGIFAFWNWPICFTSAYQISPELERLWLDNIREAKPITVHPLAKALGMIALPIGGTISALIACFAVRRDTDRLWAWATVALMTLFALALTFWQIRATPAAQLLAIPAVAWAIHKALQEMVFGQSAARRGAGLAIAAALAMLYWSSTLYPMAQRWIAPPAPANAAAAEKTQARADRKKRIERANARCRTLPALAALNQLPPATIFTLVDLGPRLIATTHHSAIAGPYHRNGDAILTIHHAFDGSPETFRAIARHHEATYFLLCPNFPEGTIYRARSPQGFYAQMERGKVPAWLHPVTVKSASELPYTLYKIEYGADTGAAAATAAPRKTP
tara:strand:+ start:126207 stop:128156 length:1950 start_codon:yes stop_codon:yes gene_type:complete